LSLRDGGFEVDGDSSRGDRGRRGGLWGLEENFGFKTLLGKIRIYSGI